MFSGIVRAVGKIQQRKQQAQDCCLYFNVPQQFSERMNDGGSVAVNGVCLTVTKHENDIFYSDVSAETLRCTTLNTLNVGDPVNLEHALRIGDAIDGHLVSGHVDGVGTITQCQRERESIQIEIEAPKSMMSLIAVKGSICIDGVSLTVNAINKTRFQVNLIPYTVENTIFSFCKMGTAVNLEVDMIARYLAKLLADRSVL